MKIITYSQQSSLRDKMASTFHEKIKHVYNSKFKNHNHNHNHTDIKGATIGGNRRSKLPSTN